MSHISKKLRLAAVAAASTMALAACGGDGDEDAPPANEADGVLTIGMLLPQTGQLAYLGPPEFAGVDLAIEEINEAGGVLGEEVVGVKADSGDGEPNIAPGEVNNLLSAGADAIIGAAASGVSFTVIDQITGAGVVQFSPANTSPRFDEYDHGGLYFRTAPSDVLQGSVISSLLTSDGMENVAILGRQDDYGEALADQVESTYTEAGGTVAAKVLYDPTASTFDTEVQQIADAGPDAVVLIGFEESARILPALADAGVGPQDAQFYLVDGNLANYGPEGENPLPDGLMEGTKGTQPGEELDGEFRDRLLEVDPELSEFSYAAESYDAAIVIALAAIAANSDLGTDIAAEIQGVTRDGTKCTTFAECKELLENGEDIDYDGISGPIELGDTGSPTQATIGVYEYGSDNTFENIDYVAGRL